MLLEGLCFCFCLPNLDTKFPLIYLDVHVVLFRYANIKLCIFQPCEGHDTKVIAIICTTVSFDTQANTRIHVEREIESYVRLVPIAWYDYIVFVLCIHLHAILVSVFFLFFLVYIP